MKKHFILITFAYSLMLSNVYASNDVIVSDSSIIYESIKSLFAGFTFIVLIIAVIVILIKKRNR